MLKEYFELIAQIDDLEQRKLALRDKLIKKGTHSTKDFICDVSAQESRSISVSDVKKHEEIMATLLEAGLIKTSKRIIVRVKPKQAA